MENEFTQAVRTLVTELNRETASGLITRQALIALDRVQRLLEAEAMSRSASVRRSADPNGAPRGQAL